MDQQQNLRVPNIQINDQEEEKKVEADMADEYVVDSLKQG